MDNSVNRIMIGHIGLSISDMEDWKWRDAYDDNSTPKEAICDYFYEVQSDHADIVSDLCS